MNSAKNAMHTEDSFSCTVTEISYSYARTKSTIARATPRSLPQGSVPRIQGHERVNSNKALMTALTQQLVPDVIEANSVFFQLYPHGDMADSGATSTNEPFSVHR